MYDLNGTCGYVIPCAVGDSEYGDDCSTCSAWSSCSSDADDCSTCCDDSESELEVWECCNDMVSCRSASCCERSCGLKKKKKKNRERKRETTRTKKRERNTLERYFPWRRKRGDWGGVEGLVRRPGEVSEKDHLTSFHRNAI